MKQDALPDDTPALLALLAERAASFQSLLREGNLTAVWFPAIGAKDVALELEEHHLGDLPVARRAAMISAVERLMRAAWQIDAAGDLGNRERLIEINREFAAAAAEIHSLYAPLR